MDTSSQNIAIEHKTKKMEYSYTYEIPFTPREINSYTKRFRNERAKDYLDRMLRMLLTEVNLLGLNLLVVSRTNEENVKETLVGYEDDITEENFYILDRLIFQIITNLKSDEFLLQTKRKSNMTEFFPV